MTKAFIYDLTPDKLAETLNALEQPAFRTKQLIQGLYNKLDESLDALDAIPKALRTSLDTQFEVTPLT
ncbi:MAG: hypothetical protein GX853_07465 [Chloroflexi bacterium]|nr:hypothetical protein [Chloroflexota bacterium]